jgi:TrmH family RNA methyltransferase
VVRLRRLVGRRSVRAAEVAYVAEGPKLLIEALEAGVALESVYAAPGADPELLAKAVAAGARVFALAEGVMERVADTVAPQPVMAVLPMPSLPLRTLSRAAWVVVCAGVRDPGNAGTVLRAARAAGAEGVVFAETSVDPYNPKTVRASAGAIFRIPVCSAGSLESVLADLSSWGFCRLAAVARGGRAPEEVDLTARFALVVGNEAHGLGPRHLATVEELVSIPMAAESESLNVGVATGVICFEAARQRRAQLRSRERVGRA